MSWTELYRQSDNLNSIEELIYNGVDVNTLSNNGDSLMHIAAMKCNIEVIEFLTNCGATVDKPNNSGETPFLCVTKNKKSSFNDIQKALGLLVDNGANIHQVDNLNLGALAKADYNFKPDVILALLKYPIDQSATPFLHDIRYIDYIPKFLKAGADIDIVSDGKKIMNEVIFWGNVRLTKFLIDAGANINHQNKNGFTPIMQTANHINDKQFKLLLDAGADLFLKDNNSLLVVDHIKDPKRKAIVEKIMLEQEIDMSDAISLGL